MVSKNVRVGGMAQSVTNIGKEKQNWKMCAGAHCGHVVEIMSQRTLFLTDIFC